MRRRHGIARQTPLPEAVTIALERGDQVAAAFADNGRLMLQGAGLAGGNSRNKADKDTVDAQKLLAIMDTLAEAKFPFRPPQTPAPKPDCDTSVVTKKRRGHYRKTELKKVAEKMEANGLIAGKALFLIGPDEGPIRIGVSDRLTEQLRRAKKHCAATPHLGFERYAISNAKALRVMREVLDCAKSRGVRHPHDDNLLDVQMATAIAMMWMIADQLAISLLSRDEKKRAVEDFQAREIREQLRQWELEDADSEQQERESAAFFDWLQRESAALKAEGRGYLRDEPWRATIILKG